MLTYEFWWNLRNRLGWKWFGRAPTPRRCCRVESNLGPIIQDAPDLTYRRCTVCDSRHFELTADPGKLGLRGAKLG